MEFCEKLQELRKQQKLTQEELASALFVSRTAVSKWESGRGYPSIDSLKAIAVFFGITVDALLSGDEILTIAEADGAHRQARFRDLFFGLLDACMLLLLCLPLFSVKSGEAAALFSLEGARLYLKVLYLAFAIATGVTGILTLALQNLQAPLWVKSKRPLSLALGIGATLLFILARQPYAAIFALTLLALKALILIKAR